MHQTWNRDIVGSSLGWVAALQKIVVASVMKPKATITIAVCCFDQCWNNSVTQIIKFNYWISYWKKLGLLNYIS